MITNITIIVIATIAGIATQGLTVLALGAALALVVLGHAIMQTPVWESLWIRVNLGDPPTE